jgi:hypothetical protein
MTQNNPYSPRWGNQNQGPSPYGSFPNDGTTQTGGMGQYLGTPSDQGQFQVQTLYNPDDPRNAMQNAMMDMGVNPFARNPYTQFLLRAAPGLGASWLAGRAVASTTPGVGADPTMAAPYFRDYLRGSLQGNGPYGGVYANIGQAAANMPQTLNAMRQWQNGFMGQNQAGQNAMNMANPYMAALSDTMAANNGAGSLAFLGSMQSPFMNQPMAQAYTTGLQNVAATGLRNYSAQPNPLTGNDIWSYLLGY